LQLIFTPDGARHSCAWKFLPEMYAYLLVGIAGLDL
jgi:hypothetical protein